MKLLALILIGLWTGAEYLTAERWEFFEAWGGQVAAPGIAGEYRDFYGGDLILKDAGGGKWDFQLSVVRGPTAYTGEISGTAKLNAAKTEAVFRDAETPPAILRWAFRPDGSVAVTGENTGQYHGARAYFDGRYYKVSGVDPEE